MVLGMFLNFWEKDASPLAAEKGGEVLGMVFLAYPLPMG